MIKGSVEPWCLMTSIVVSMLNICLNDAENASECNVLPLLLMPSNNVPSMSILNVSVND